MKRLTTIIAIISILAISGDLNAQSIKKYTESASHFNGTIELSSKDYPDSTLYRAYKKGKTGGSSLNKLQTQTENKIREFAKKQGKSFVILGQKNSNPPYLLGNYPRIEIIFALKAN